MLNSGPKRGRGASGNIPNRFMQVDYIPYDDAEWLAEDLKLRPKTQFLTTAR